MRALFFGDVPHRLAGAQRSLLAALSNIGERGIEPTIIFPTEGAFVDACRRAQLDVRVLSGPPAFQTFGGGLTRMRPAAQLDLMVRELLPYAHRLARIVDREGAEVIHFNTARGAIMVGLAALLSGRSAVLHVRGFVPVGRTYWVAAQAVASWFVLVAHFLEQELLPSLRARSRVVHNGVQIPDPIPRETARAALAARWGIPSSSDPLFLSLSSPVPYKGLHHVLDAASDLKRRGIEARLLFAGVGHGDAYETWLRSRAEELGLGRQVHWLGFVEDTRDLLFASDALVLSSVEQEELCLPDGKVLRFGCREGLPRSILEAMAAGLPVVASTMGGVTEQVEDGSTGILVPPSDSRALAEAMAKLVEDRPFRETAGQRGREVIRARFGIPAAAEGLADVLRLAATERPSLDRALDFVRFCRDGLFELGNGGSAPRAVAPFRRAPSDGLVDRAAAGQR